MTAPINGTLCYTVDPGRECVYDEQKKRYIEKISRERRATEERIGLCKCSTEDGIFLRNVYPGGCPKHPRKKRQPLFYRKLVMRAGILVEDTD